MTHRPRLLAVLLVSVLIAGPAATAQGPTFVPSPTLMDRADVRAAADAIDSMRHFGGTLVRLHAAYEADKAERTSGRVAASFVERVGFQAVRGDRVLIDASAPSEAAAAELAADLAAIGFQETGRYRHIVSGYLPLDAIGAAAGVSSLRAAHASVARTGRLSADQLADIAEARARVGAEEGEASIALRADKARSLFGVDGSGLVIGVLSDSYDNLGGAAGGVVSGDLPAGVIVVDELDAVGGGSAFPGSDEGRAMMELAFDVAPGVGFAFHTAFEGVGSFASGIDDLIAAGADIVVDDVGYTAQPPFQDDIIAQAVDAAFAGGTPYFSAAGNSADAGYDGTWADSGLDAAFDGGTVTGDLHDFDPGPGVDAFQEISTTSGVGVDEAITLAFHFDEPSLLASATGPTSDYDIYFLDTPSVGASVLASATTDNPATGLPFESISLTGSGTFYVAIIKVSGDDRELAYLNFGSPIATIAGAEYNVAPTINGHPKAAGAFSTGASAWFTSPASGTGLLETVVNSFSSYGGRDIVLAPDGTRLGAPEDRSKPDAVGSDGDNNTFFGSDVGDGNPAPNFFGTSAAAPNAAAVAALMIEAAGGSLSPTAIYGTLEATAEDLADADATNPDTAPGFDDRSGDGFIRADRAVAAVATPSLAVRINELDTDQAGTDSAEFIELVGPAMQSLDGLLLVGVNGGTDTDYRVADLDGEALGADGLHVTCGGTVAGCDLDLTPDTNYLQNDAEAMVLALGEAFDYSTGRLEIPSTFDIIDVLLHAAGGGTADAPDAGLIAALGTSTTYDEAVRGGDSATQSLGRLNGSAYTDSRSTLFYPQAPSPGVANPEAYTLTESTIFDGPGFRLLATPFAETRTAGGVDVTDIAGGTAIGQLAAINMVQGVPAGSTFPAEYASSDPNVLVSYTGTSYGSPMSADGVLTPGQGFFWYWFDNALGPFAGGTSVSRELSAFSLELGGIPTEVGFATPVLPLTTDGFYLLGNPFPYDLVLTGVGTFGSTLSTGFFTYDPDGGTFVALTSTDAVAPLQGFFPEVTAGPGSPGSGAGPTFAFDETLIEADLRAPEGDFVGRRAVEERISLRLDGLTSDGDRLAERAAMVRLLADATEGFDRHDLSKLTPPGDHAQLAPVGSRDDAPYRQAILSLPKAHEGEVAVAFETTQPGTFTLTWALQDVDEARALTLTDRTTGAVVDLWAAEGYTFEATAAEWTDRFVLRLGDDLSTDTAEDAPEALVGLVAPNPTAGTASVTVRLAEGGPVRVAVLDVLGREVAVPFVGSLPAGGQRLVALDAGALAPGAYFVRVTGPGVAETRRLSVVR